MHGTVDSCITLSPHSVDSVKHPIYLEHGLFKMEMFLVLVFGNSILVLCYAVLVQQQLLGTSCLCSGCFFAFGLIL